MMKAVALILALAVITGCKAHVVQQADTTTDYVWSAIVDQVGGYLSRLDQKSGGVAQNVNAPQISRELDTLITDTIQTKLKPYIETSTGEFTQDLERVVNKYMLAKQLDTQPEGLTTQELRASLEANIAEVVEQLAPLVTRIHEKIKTIVEKVKETAAA